MHGAQADVVEKSLGSNFVPRLGLQVIQAPIGCSASKLNLLPALTCSAHLPAGMFLPRLRRNLLRTQIRIHIEEIERLSIPQRQDIPADLVIVTGLKSGDQGAMAQLYDRYSSVVYAVALRVLGDTGAAEDVLQEVFLQLWRNPGAFDAARGSLASWLAVITRNRAIDVLRKRRPETDIEDVVLSVAPDLAGEAERARAAAKIRGVLGTMAATQRQALEMAYWEGMSHSEIADKTGEPLGTIKTRIRTGLMVLRKAFQS
jgi:RNA polymerase sigma-70 factor (ECF subfamily)